MVGRKMIKHRRMDRISLFSWSYRSSPLVLINLFNSMLKSSTETKITYNEFIEMVDKGEVEKVTVMGSEITIIPKKQPFPGIEISYTTGRMDDSELTQRLLDAHVQCEYKVQDTTKVMIYNLLATLASPDSDLGAAVAFHAEDVKGRRRHERREK